MTEKERMSCIKTIEKLKQLVYNTHGALGIADEQNCNKIIAMLNAGWVSADTRMPEMTKRRERFFKDEYFTYYESERLLLHTEDGETLIGTLYQDAETKPHFISEDDEKIVNVVAWRELAKLYE